MDAGGDAVVPVAGGAGHQGRQGPGHEDTQLSPAPLQQPEEGGGGPLLGRDVQVQEEKTIYMCDLFSGVTWKICRIT